MNKTIVFRFLSHFFQKKATTPCDEQRYNSYFNMLGQHDANLGILNEDTFCIHKRQCQMLRMD